MVAQNPSIQTSDFVAPNPSIQTADLVPLVKTFSFSQYGHYEAQDCDLDRHQDSQHYRQDRQDHYICLQNGQNNYQVGHSNGQDGC